MNTRIVIWEAVRVQDLMTKVNRDTKGRDVLDIKYQIYQKDTARGTVPVHCAMIIYREE